MDMKKPRSTSGHLSLNSSQRLLFEHVAQGREDCDEPTGGEARENHTVGKRHELFVQGFWLFEEGKEKLRRRSPIAGDSPAAITGYLSSIESLGVTNFRKWKEQISIILGVMDLDYALRVDALAALTTESSTEQKMAYEKWKRSNRISLIIMKGSITTVIREAIPDSNNAKMYISHIEEQFQCSSKAHATTLITKMVTLKCSGSSGVREHILQMNDMTSQLKGLDTKISEGFLVHFIMTSILAQFGPFKINYKMPKEKWKMNELISMCIQEEERLKSEQPDGAHIAIIVSENDFNLDLTNTGYVPSMAENLISVSELDAYGYSFKFKNKNVSLFFIGSGLLEGNLYKLRLNASLTESLKAMNVNDIVAKTCGFSVGAPLPQIEDKDALKVVPNDVPPIMDLVPISVNEQPLRRSGRERWTTISDDYIVYLDEADYNLGI
ncbi:hypothetical protein RJ640_003918 [Escallonia rubra]|uniref:Uncharacterized protein n=1 Tax=Escallonia rubra TaxID=112253 RepID=A0AA88UP67_9ASTE|nr:hypothetical protein RJ640_003918 [Escallonia rubra]